MKVPILLSRTKFLPAQNMSPLEKYGINISKHQPYVKYVVQHYVMIIFSKSAVHIIVKNIGLGYGKIDFLLPFPFRFIPVRTFTFSASNGKLLALSVSRNPDMTTDVTFVGLSLYYCHY
jgi:hypothetical protein